MKNKITVVKLGGNIIDGKNALKDFLFNFSQIEGNKILVHGGGKIATKIAAQLGVETQMIDGRRVTDQASLDVVTMVYAGLLNKNIVAQLQEFHCNAIGLSGADGNLIPASKRKSIPDFGFVGDPIPENVNIGLLSSLVEQGISPVICPLTHENGMLLNTNADTIAAVVASALTRRYEVELIYCFERSGVLLDSEDEGTLFTELTEGKLDELISNGKIHSGMLPKIKAARSAVKNNVHRVVIGNASQLIAIANGSTACTTLL